MIYGKEAGVLLENRETEIYRVRSVHELFKYVLDDSAIGAFVGKIYVAPGAQKTEALMTNKNLCATPTAKMKAKPQLEIYADDVKCSHDCQTRNLQR